MRALPRAASQARADLDEEKPVLVGDGLQLVEAGRVAHHVDGHDGPGARRDPGPHVGGVEVEGPVHLGQHRHGAGVDDRRQAGDEGVTRYDDLVARPDAQAGERG
jgi:hypothetical protein